MIISRIVRLEVTAEHTTRNIKAQVEKVEVQKAEAKHLKVSHERWQNNGDKGGITMDVREKTSNEKRLIDADIRKIATALKMIHDADFTPGVYEHSVYGKAALLLEKDAVEVVRCRDCQHWKPSGSKAGNSFSNMEYIGGCEFTNYYRRESDFCNYGERKEDAD